MIDQVSFMRLVSPESSKIYRNSKCSIIGLGEAIQFLSQFDMKEIHDHENNLLVNARGIVSEIVWFKVWDYSNKAPVLSFTMNRFIITIWLLFLMQKVLQLEPSPLLPTINEKLEEGTVRHLLRCTILSMR